VEQRKLWNLATAARERRRAIREIITQMNGSSDQHANSDPFPGAIDKLSDPAFECRLPFPFVPGTVPDRFKADEDGTWPYVGREKFKELLQEVKNVRKCPVYSVCWLYGTQGYGKSHLLAALVCYLAAQDERIIYLPTCPSFLSNPVPYFQAAMLFAWANDLATQKKIMTLNTRDKIDEFFEYKTNVIFVVDKLHAFKSDNPEEAAERATLRCWLDHFTLDYKAVFSSSPNCANCTYNFERFTKGSVIKVARVYGGLTRVSHSKFNSPRASNLLDGNGSVVEPT